MQYYPTKWMVYEYGTWGAKQVRCKLQISVEACDVKDLYSVNGNEVAFVAAASVFTPAGAQVANVALEGIVRGQKGLIRQNVNINVRKLNMRNRIMM